MTSVDNELTENSVIASAALPTVPKAKIHTRIAELRVSDDELRQLHDFEEDCMDDLARKKRIADELESERRVQSTVER